MKYIVPAAVKVLADNIMCINSYILMAGEKLKMVIQIENVVLSEKLLERGVKSIITI